MRSQAFAVRQGAVQVGARVISHFLNREFLSTFSFRQRRLYAGSSNGEQMLLPKSFITSFVDANGHIAHCRS